MEKTPTIIITGSSGFIGSYFTSRFSEDGFKVRAFQRKIPPHRAGPITYYSFNLSEVKDEGFNGADYLIHCAYQPNPKDLESDINISAAKKIISLARKYNITLPKDFVLLMPSRIKTARSAYSKQDVSFPSKIFSHMNFLFLLLLFYHKKRRFGIAI